jgi:protein tyrosine phosphatase (PTP) superfamily phosphohydrolase (DUF442 family)
MRLNLSLERERSGWSTMSTPGSRFAHSALNALAFTDIRNFRQVAPDLAASGQPTEADLSDIATAGYAVVINLALHDDARYSLPDERRTVEALGMQYIHIPVQFAAPTEADLAAFCGAMIEFRGQKTWVHCAANMRVTAFLGLYRVLHEGWERGAAFELMDGVWKPNEVWHTFIARQLEASTTRP